ncbi:hypothetical protein SASPL_123178 [Salvia splendens]|uniref:Uncharacterized protein n=1 Tax=Salvia splendens TaxID=180675 RepID=A0A8X8XL78_SALSN|nr:hypothetical protein SASPL_123178 [Salvia splendens]
MEHGEMCWPLPRSCSARNYGRFEAYDMAEARSSRAPIWRVLWKRIKREKKRRFPPFSNSNGLKFNYDPSSYSQNFDDQTSTWADADDISRTFSARFAVSSRFFANNSLIV